jgi:uncharacterized protein (DUF1778 family)
VSFWLKNRELSRVDDAAKRLQQSRSAFVRDAVLAAARQVNTQTDEGDE